jgi:hypothetical protein
MISQDEIKVVDDGQGFTIGELPKQHKQLRYLNDHSLVCLFSGVDTLLEFVKKNMPKAKRSEASSKERDEWDDDDFNAFKNYDQALDTFINKPEKVVKFNPAELRIKDDSEAGNTVEYDVVGDYIDMGRHMEGIPESWGSMRNGNARNRRVNILINLNQMWNVNHKDITHRGERILRLVDALEAGGVRTELIGIESNECGHTEVVLKHHEEPLTISDLAVVTHPEFLRRIIFRINEHSKTWDYGYGSAIKFSQVLDSKPEMLHSDLNDEMNIFVDANMRSIEFIDQTFDKLERLLVWEMSKPVPEVDAVKIGDRGIYFNANGARSEAEVQREGMDAING